MLASVRVSCFYSWRWLNHLNVIGDDDIRQAACRIWYLIFEMSVSSLSCTVHKIRPFTVVFMKVRVSRDPGSTDADESSSWRRQSLATLNLCTSDFTVAKTRKRETKFTKIGLCIGHWKLSAMLSCCQRTLLTNCILIPISRSWCTVPGCWV